MHVTRGEVFSWITEWVEDFGVEWRECPQTISDKKAGLTSDLKALLEEDRDLRLVFLEKPVPKSLVVDLDFFYNSNVDRSYIDVGRQSRKRLKESAFGGFLRLEKYIKRKTKIGARLKGSENVRRYHRFTDGAQQLWESGVKIIDLVDDELELIAEPKKL
ncbi:MAG: hypothetical protein ACK56W_10470 [Pirellula sp.]|jgi:hypothetical protein|nr:hypothetical protein [Pirellula sp.]